MKKNIKKLIASIIASITLAIPFTSIDFSGGQTQVANAALIDYDNLGRYWGIDHIIRTFERYYLENGYFSIPKMLGNRDSFNRFLFQCADRDIKLFNEYLYENMKDFIYVSGNPHILTFDEWLYTMNVTLILSGRDPVDQGDPDELAHYYDLYEKIFP
ncbi:hypothetical protein [Candidatus Arthromitus sp. SFB-turkey]|uniref:hypothetical protein n=1 Tax=Candidatus Arthromitus sp. SFB-turkey TaxID=1840217 RepID=UPI0007F45C52|nr:hypothetical protein [Candidatus Arthromitus sp. SFB-turkey]OAT86885.1 hypothetical protein A6P36_04920 [Candidatus Arthromitus sp. SFB-turkey]